MVMNNQHKKSRAYGIIPFSVDKTYTKKVNINMLKLGSLNDLPKCLFIDTRGNEVYAHYPLFPSLQLLSNDYNIQSIKNHTLNRPMSMNREERCFK